MDHFTFRSGFVAALAASWLGCHSQPAAQQFAVDIQVESDPGKPLAAAKIVRGEREYGQTGADGHLRLELSGPPGEVLTLNVVCPSGYASPDEALSVALRTLVGDSALPRYRALCPPHSRSLVVAVRAKNGPDLPVLHQGREIARTDADGTAHVLLTAEPTEHVTLALDTSAPNKKALLPRSPEFTLVMPGRDEVAVFNPAFTLPAPAVKKVRAQAPQPLGPTPILPGSR
jgi:hypothetical protein